MKRKIFLLIWVVVTTMLAAFGMSACFKDNQPIKPTDKKEYRIVYEIDDKGKDEFLTVKEGDPFVSLKVLPSIEGYVFLGLNDAKEGGVQYFDAKGKIVQNIIISSDMRLYPQYKEREITISFDCSGLATQDIDNIVVAYSGNVPSLPNMDKIKPSNEAKYEFIGWYTAADGKGEQISASDGKTEKSVADLYKISKSEKIKLYPSFKIRTYTVKFYDCYNFTESGTGYNVTPIKVAEEVEYGTPLSEVAPTTRKGGSENKILEWSKEPNYNVYTDAITSNLELYVYKYEVILTYNTDGGTPVNIEGVTNNKKVGSNKDKFVVNNTLSKKDPLELIGWYDAAGNPAPEYFADNTTIKAVWKKVHFIVTYNIDGKLETEEVQEGKLVSLNEKTKEYYSFLGWEYNKKIYNKNAEQDNELKMPSKDITLIAKFEQTHYVVKYIVDGVESSEHVKVGKPVLLTERTKEYYAFLGWVYDSKVYNQNGEQDNELIMPSKDITLIAKFEQTHYKVVKSVDGVKSSEYVRVGVQVPFTTPTKRCYTFKNWVYEGKKYNQGDELKMPAKDIELTAEFELTAYWVTFNNSDGVEVKIGQSVTLPTLTKSGYTFVGWSLNGQTYQNTFTPAQNVNLTSVFSAKKFTISLSVDGGSVSPTTISVTYDSTFSLPVPTKEGHDFTGWYTQNSGGNQVTYNNGNSVSVYTNDGNMTVFAHWKIKEYTISLNPNGGSFTSNNNSGKASYNQPYTLPVPKKEGHDFKGWYGEDGYTYWADSNGRSVGVYPCLNDASLVAHWEIKTYKVYRENKTENGKHVTLNFDGKGLLSNEGQYFEYTYGSIVVFTFGFDKDWSYPTVEEYGRAPDGNQWGPLQALYYHDRNRDAGLQNTGDSKIKFTVPADDVVIVTRSSKGSSCFAPGTLITVAGGDKKPIEELSVGDIILSWNFMSGAFEFQPIAYYWDYAQAECNIVNLEFSDGSLLRIVGSHAVFDITDNVFVYINEFNCKELIGHDFVSVNNNEHISVKLVNAFMTKETTKYYSLETIINGNAVAEGLLTLTPQEYVELFMPFEVGDNLKFDEEKMQAEIEKYGLYAYEEWQDYLTIEEFYAFNVQYLKIAVCKGVMTKEDLIDLAKRYVSK